MDITIESFKVHWNDAPSALLDIPNWSVQSGSRILLKGPSGSGKTTLLHCISGLMRPTEGRILVGETNTVNLSESESCLWRRNSVSVVFQRLNLLRHLTALENVCLAARGVPNPKETARQALQKLDMVRHIDRIAEEMSLGEQQRVAVARAVAWKSDLILADEPTSSLDEANTELVARTLLETSEVCQCTLIVVSHDQRLQRHFPHVVDIEEVGRA
ncbi:MAG TPA: ATP-binding cassette domain-containing protein [bacterium]|nr:ATP-binding cassette domain-containing protein [bacterium]